MIVNILLYTMLITSLSCLERGIALEFPACVFFKPHNSSLSQTFSLTKENDGGGQRLIQSGPVT